MVRMTWMMIIYQNYKVQAKKIKIKKDKMDIKFNNKQNKNNSMKKAVHHKNNKTILQKEKQHYMQKEDYQKLIITMY